MVKRKLEIIDKTLVVLDSLYGEKIRKKIPLLRALIKLLHEIGSDYIEITPELYKALCPLPEGIYIRISNKLRDIEGELNIHGGFNKELIGKNNKSFRIIGLDDVIFYDYEKIFLDIIKEFGNNIEMCIKNEYNSAIAMSLEWIRSGGRKIVTTFAGIGGYASLESILGSLEFLENMKPRGNYVLFPEVLKIFEEITENEIKPNTPFIGKDIFNVESGIHVNGIAKNPSTYEPYDPSKIGRKRQIIIGKHSGVSSLEIKLKELHIEYKDNNLSNMLEKIRRICTQKKRGLNDEEIRQLFMSCGKCV
ncbi:isopropylmalate synthase [Clostridium sp.]|uniref:homocitrate synthase/isopropylmalate synthase family protein n=1 Tax=Clostridium sp. TaxID=1506 RepID=UPI00284E97CD|nr:isopropylmalate synthase [Clostridium sp.]MDR3595266.1 isopropylmalate synthase [Clostridium sp.]